MFYASPWSAIKGNSSGRLLACFNHCVQRPVLALYPNIARCSGRLGEANSRRLDSNFVDLFCVIHTTRKKLELFTVKGQSPGRSWWNGMDEGLVVWTRNEAEDQQFRLFMALNIHFSWRFVWLWNGCIKRRKKSKHYRDFPYIVQ